jgi:predicted metal-dependent hydrolase
MPNNNNEISPLIVAFVSNLMFSTKIANVARHHGYRVQWVENAAQIGDIDPDAPVETPGEMLHGREAKLFEKITQWQPALLLFDLTNQEIPWRQWIPALKSSPATRRFPVMGFGPHEDVETIKEARRVGTDVVLARSKFTADMPALFAKHARVYNRETLAETCQEPLSDLAIKGIKRFNQGEYYPCHDYLEAAWMADQGPGRDLYRGILQIAIAYYQIERSNYRGATKMLLRVRQWLDPLPDVCRGVNIVRLREDAKRVYTSLTELGPDHINNLDRTLFRPVEVVVT